MKLHFTPKALAELEDVLAYTAEHSPRGARRVHRRLRSMIDFVARYPQAGTQIKGRGMRRVAVVPFPYLVFCRVEDDEVVIVGVRHSARDHAEPTGRP